MMKNLLSLIHRIGTFDITLASCAWRISGKVGMGGVMIRECRSKWKGASFFGPGSRPVAIEGRCISGRARLF